MVTHIPPPPSSLSGSSLSSTSFAVAHSAVGISGHPLPSSSRQHQHVRSRSAHPPTLPPSVFPPSPPSSQATSQPTESAYAETIVPPRYRRPPSVTSRASTSAVRLSGRQRSGSTSSRVDTAQQATNAFPWFATTGDVEITICDRTGRHRIRKYLLHSLILAQNSGFFAAEIGDAATGRKISVDAINVHSSPLPGGNTFARLEGHRSGSSSTSSIFKTEIKWRYVLDWGGNPSGVQNDDILPILVQLKNVTVSSSQPPSVRNKPYSSSFRNLSSSHISIATSGNISSTQRDDDMIVAYDNLFRTFYNHTPRLDTNNLATAYVECKALLGLASLYSALPAVGSRVDHHLLCFQGRLWRQVAKYPASYHKLGFLARSRAIFTEAMIHVVGAWPAHEGQLRRGQIDDSLFDLIADKVDELEDMRCRIEGKLFRLNLTTSRGERVSPSNSWTDWLAVSLFRQHLAESTTPASASILKGRTQPHQITPVLQSSGYAFRILGRGGNGYLVHEDLRRFIKLARPEGYSSRDTLKRFERRIEELKSLARDVVKPLTRNFLELDQGRVDELPYLSCCKLSELDYNFVWGHG